MFSLLKVANSWQMVGKFLKKTPKLIGVQASGCSPVTKAFEKNREIKPEKKPKTLATAIECGYPLDGKRALKAIKDSKGIAFSVTDNEILKAREILSRKEGIFAEPAGAVSLAGILKNKNKIKKGSKVVCIITGHGLKTPKSIVKGTPKKIGKNHVF